VGSERRVPLSTARRWVLSSLRRFVAPSLCRSDATRRSHSLTRPAGRSPGTGAIWKGVAGLLPKDRQLYNAEAVGVDLEAKTVSFKDGSSIEYDQLVSTVPLDVLLRWTGMSNLADGLMYSSSHIVGIGIRGKCPHGSKCWLYYPVGVVDLGRRAHTAPTRPTRPTRSLTVLALPSISRRTTVRSIGRPSFRTTPRGIVRRQRRSSRRSASVRAMRLRTLRPVLVLSGASS